MTKITFVDLKTKKKFTTESYTIKKLKNGRKMAQAKSPSGGLSSLFVSNDFK